MGRVGHRQSRGAANLSSLRPTVGGMASYRPTQARVDATVEMLGPGPWHVSQLLGMGWTHGALQRCTRSGLLVRERRGLYALPVGAIRQLVLTTAAPRTPAPRALNAAPRSPADAHRARLRAVARGLTARAVFSHSSAARVHGLWTPDPTDLLLHATIPGQADREDGRLRIHGSGLQPSSVVRVDGIAVTDVVRTALDLARATDLPQALVAADSAMRLLLSPAHPDLDRVLRRRAVPRQEIEGVRAAFSQALEPMVGWPGVRTARAAVAAADPASASPYESWSRGWMLVVGMPLPELNVVLVGASGAEYVGDFVWRDRRLIGEADGVSKYGSTSAEVRAALRAEKARQADLEAAGWRLVRWVPGDSGATLVARLARALYLTPTGSTRALERGA